MLITADFSRQFFLHVQGSGVVEYENGEQKVLSCGGVKGHAIEVLGQRKL